MELAGPFHYQIGMEIDMIRFYSNIVAEEIQKSNGSPSIESFLRVKDAYCKWTIQNRLSSISFEDPGMRCAYIFLNTPCFSGTVAFHFQGLMRNNPWLLQRILYQGTLSVCCLGGGPAPELVGILKVLENLLKFSRTRNIVVRATVVDIDPGWQATAKWMTQNWWKHFDQSLIKLQVTFIQADLTDSVGPEVQEAVRSSDVVTMVKFLSAVYGTFKRDNIPSMFQEIVDCLAVGSVVFYMNSPRFGCMRALNEVIVSDKHMSTIYGPVCDYVYRLSTPAMAKCFQLYFRYYGLLPPTPENKSDVIVWYKRNQTKITY